MGDVTKACMLVVFSLKSTISPLLSTQMGYQFLSPTLYLCGLYLDLSTSFLSSYGMSMYKFYYCSCYVVFEHLYIQLYCNSIKKQNAVFMGLWLGKDKPDMCLFLKPFVSKLKTLYQEGG